MSDTKTNSMGMNKLKEKISEVIDSLNIVSYEGITTIEAAKACTAITIEQMGLFAEWTQGISWVYKEYDNHWVNLFYHNSKKTTSELITEYIKTL